MLNRYRHSEILTLCSQTDWWPLLHLQKEFQCKNHNLKNCVCSRYGSHRMYTDNFGDPPMTSREHISILTLAFSLKLCCTFFQSYWYVFGCSDLLNSRNDIDSPVRVALKILRKWKYEQSEQSLLCQLLCVYCGNHKNRSSQLDLHLGQCWLTKVTPCL